MGASAALFLLVGGTSALSYGVFVKQWEGPGVRWITRVTHFPAARLGWRNVPYTEYLNHFDAERRFLSGPSAKTQGVSSEITPESRKMALDRAMRIAAVEDLAFKYDFSLTSKDIDGAYDQLVARAGTSTTPEEIETFLRDEFGWNKEEFKWYVIRPALFEDGLKQKLLVESPTSTPVETQLQERLNAPDVQRYLRF